MAPREGLSKKADAVEVYRLLDRKADATAVTEALQHKASQVREGKGARRGRGGLRRWGLRGVFGGQAR